MQGGSFSACGTRSGWVILPGYSRALQRGPAEWKLFCAQLDLCQFALPLYGAINAHWATGPAPRRPRSLGAVVPAPAVLPPAGLAHCTSGLLVPSSALQAMYEISLVRQAVQEAQSPSQVAFLEKYAAQCMAQIAAALRGEPVRRRVLPGARSRAPAQRRVSASRPPLALQRRPCTLGDRVGHPPACPTPCAALPPTPAREPGSRSRTAACWRASTWTTWCAPPRPSWSGWSEHRTPLGPPLWPTIVQACSPPGSALQMFHFQRCLDASRMRCFPCLRAPELACPSRMGCNLVGQLWCVFAAPHGELPPT